MNRVIKFRVPHYRGKDFKFFSYWGRIDHKGNPSDDCFTSPSTSNVSPKQDEQFTELTDKNGKEIYEGDIVKVEYGYGQVENHSGCFMIVWIDDKEANMELLSMRDYRTGRSRNNIEIIGNIHEPLNY